MTKKFALVMPDALRARLDIAASNLGLSSGAYARMAISEKITEEKKQ